MTPQSHPLASKWHTVVHTLPPTSCASIIINSTFLKPSIKKKKTTLNHAILVNSGNYCPGLFLVQGHPGE